MQTLLHCDRIKRNEEKQDAEAKRYVPYPT